MCTILGAEDAAAPAATENGRGSGSSDSDGSVPTSRRRPGPLDPGRSTGNSSDEDSTEQQQQQPQRAERVNIAAEAHAITHLPFEVRASILFEKADVNGNNKIGLSEFVRLLSDGFGVSTDSMSQREIRHLFKDLDVGRTGSVEAHDYLNFMADPAAEVVIDSLRNRKQSIGTARHYPTGLFVC